MQIESVGSKRNAFMWGLDRIRVILLSSHLREGRLESHHVCLWFPKLADHENYLKNFEKTDFLVSHHHWISMFGGEAREHALVKLP